MYYLWTKENLLESSKRIIHFPKFVRQEKKLPPDNLELGSVENQHYGTPNLIFACVSQETLHLAPFFFTGLRFNHKKDKKSRRRCLYYLNSCAYRQLLLQCGNISVNPGPAVLKPSAPRCSGCERPVAKNHKRCICSVCFDVAHAKCSKISDPKHVLSSVPKEWVCPQCTVTVLPFYNHNLFLSNTSCTSELSMTEDTTLVDEHVSALIERSRQVRLCHYQHPKHGIFVWRAFSYDPRIPV